MFIDTHTHLDLKQLKSRLDEIILQANQNNVKKFIIPGIESNTITNIEKICSTRENIFFAAGNHPNRIDSFNIDFISRHVNHDKCVAIGECGLDWFRIPKNEDIKLVKAKQIDIFKQQIELSILARKPLILHSRDTDQEMFDTLKPYFGKVTGVIHCYVGSELLLELTKQGFYVGIGGIITYPNNEIVKILKKIPVEKILLETDSPYLTPKPFQNKLNEPKYIKNIFNFLAEQLNFNKKDLESIIEFNTKSLFAIY